MRKTAYPTREEFEKKTKVGFIALFFIVFSAIVFEYWGYLTRIKQDKELIAFEDANSTLSSLLYTVNELLVVTTSNLYSGKDKPLPSEISKISVVDAKYNILIGSRALEPKEMALVVESKRNWDSLREILNEYFDAGKTPYSIGEIISQGKLVTTPLYLLHESFHDRFEGFMLRLGETERRLNYIFLILIILGLAGTGAVGYSIYRSMTGFLREREAIFEAVRTSATKKELEDALHTVLQNAISLSNAHKGGIFLVERSTYEVLTSVSIGLSEEYLESVRIHSLRLPGARAVLDNKVVSVSNTLDNDAIKSIPDFYENVKKEGIKSYVVIPLSAEGGPIGALTLYRTSLKPFSDKDIHIAQTYAYFISNILDRLYHERFTDSIRKRYQDLFTNVPIGLYRSTPDGRILDVNPALLTILGYPDEETLKATPLENLYVNPEDRKVWMETLKKTGTFENYEYQLYKYDGSKIWVSDSARVIYGPKGEPLYYEGSLKDITARIRAQKDAESRYNRLETLYQLTSALVEGLTLPEIYRIALDGIKKILNADRSGILLLDENGVMRWKAWSGLSEEYRNSTEGHNPWESPAEKYRPILISDTTQSEEIANFRDLMSRENIRAVGFFPIVYHGKLLGKFMVYYADVHEFNDEEIQVGIACAEHLAIAITRASTEQELKTLQQGIQNTADAVFVTDAESKIIYVNPAFEEITGYTLKELAGKTPNILKSGLHPPEFYKDMYKILDSGEPFHYVFVDKKKDGTIFYFEQTITAIRDPSGKVINYVSIGRDITEEVEKRKRETAKRERVGSQHDAIRELISHPSISDGEPGEVFQFVAKLTAETLKASVVTIWLYDRPRERLLNLAKYSSEVDLSGIPDEFPPGEIPHYMEAISSGSNIVSSDVSKEKTLQTFYGNYLKKLGVTSIIDVPIRARGEVVGILCIGNQEAKEWEEDEVSFATQVADILSQILLNQEIRKYTKELESLKENLEELVEQRTKDIQTLYEISQDISVALNVEDLIEIASEGLLTLIDYDLAAFLFHRPPMSNLYFYLARPVSQGVKDELVSIASNLYYQHKETWLNLDEITIHENEVPDYPTSKVSMKSLSTIFHMPLFAGAELVGFIIIGKEAETQISPEQARTLYTFAWQLSQALERVLQIRESGLQQISKVLEFMPQGVVLLDHSKRIQLSNPTGRDIIKKIGKVDESGCLLQIADRKVEDYISSEKRDITQEVSAIVDGEERYYRLTSKLVTLSSDVHACLFIMSDITKEKEIQNRLSQQGRLASVGQLAAGIAHDFNNILQGIMGYAEVIKLNENAPDEIRNHANIILEQGRRAASLIRQILDFSRKTIVKMQSIDLHSFLNDVLSLLKRTLPETIKVTLDITPDGEYIIQGSSPQLQQVFTNLATNARDAMPEGGELMFRLSKIKVEENKDKPIPELTPGEWAVISVTDTGHGIPPELLPRIFEPFFTTKTWGIGTGLGLAQVYGIIRQHNGFIDAKSIVGIGTTFFIYLPILSETRWRPKEERDVSKITEVPMKGAGILFLDDDPTVLNVGKRMLEDLGYIVYPFLDPEEAVKKFSELKNDIELIITDLTMPGMSGLDLYYKLREVKPDVKVVLISGYAIEDAKNLLKQGICGFLPKPFTLNDVKSMLVSVLGEFSD